MDFAIGIDWGGTNVKIGLVGTDGKVYERETLKTEELIEYDSFFLKVSGSIKKIISEDKNVLGVGVGAPGIIDSERGFIYDLPNISGWKNIDFSERLQQEVNYPVFIDNDVNVMALAEHIYGAGKGKDNVICITLGTGVGGGLILDGKLYRGTSGNAGEIGHYTIDEKGPLCGCGNKGCVETYVGNRRISEKAKALLKERPDSQILNLVSGDEDKITPKVISQAANQGDALAKEIWNEVGDFLGIVLANAVNLLNPDLIVIGGGVAKAGKILFDSIDASIKKRALKLPYEKVKIVSAALGDEAGIIGGATVVFNNMNKERK